ncbi:uncharacterized protein LOC127594540 [Hippocampus zosterae]|uniref:uncharacterized protein LOC127594540 n=1 Tax=Hippocampus zosterae TaxID=109293 RepID=UPI00223DB61B|nr:uncharacterized protein LOC127594540 [Hippocampus zosterae]
MDWQISQFFGDKSSMDKACDEDIISAVAFNREGTHLCLGDKAGRLILFSEKESRKATCKQFQYFTELQSHVQDFDPLKRRNLYVLSTNDKIIKLWKMSEKVIKKVIKGSDKELSMPVLQKVEETIYPSLHKCFPSLHTSKVKAISASHNEEFLLSAEEEKDIKEAISSCCFHPNHDNVFLLSTNMGTLRLVDTRVRVTNPDLVNFGYTQGPKNFFSELIASCHDAKFFPNANYIASRDVLAVRTWDLRVAEQPVTTVPINSQVKGKLCEMYENECLWDQFSLSVNASSKMLLTGSYHSAFNIIDAEGRSNLQLDLSFSKKTTGRETLGIKAEPITDYDYKFKTLKSICHPTQDLVAVTCLNSLFFYTKKKAI